MNEIKEVLDASFAFIIHDFLSKHKKNMLSLSYRKSSQFVSNSRKDTLPDSRPMAKRLFHVVEHECRKSGGIHNILHPFRINQFSLMLQKSDNADWL